MPNYMWYENKMRATKSTVRTTKFRILVVLRLPTFESNFATLLTDSAKHAHLPLHVHAPPARTGGGPYTFRLTCAAKHGHHILIQQLHGHWPFNHSIVLPDGLGSLYMVNHCNRKKGPAQKRILWSLQWYQAGSPKLHLRWWDYKIYPSRYIVILSGIEFYHNLYRIYL